MRTRTAVPTLLAISIVLVVGGAPTARANQAAVLLASAGRDSLAATTDVPWNPPEPVSSRRTWEQAVLLPGRIASLPLSGLGSLTRRLLLYLEDSGRIPTGPQAPRERSRPLLSIGLPRIGDGAGVGASLQLQTPARGALPAFSARHAATHRHYHSTTLGVSRGPIALQYGHDWRPRDLFFGIGAQSDEDSLTDFGLEDDWVRATLTWASADSVRYGPRLLLQTWGGPRSRITRSGHDETEHSYQEFFPAIATTSLDRRVEHLVYGAAAAADWRVGRPHWSSGGRVRATGERLDTPREEFALHTAQDRGAQFTRLTLETEQGFSFLKRDPRTLRFFARVVDHRIDAHPERFLFSDLARLGGRDGISGFSRGRFRDVDALLMRVQYVFPLARLFEFEVHSEWGSVYPDVWKDPTFSSLENSVGFTMRGRNEWNARGAVGLDVSREGVRMHYILGRVE
jgi:hypothetical protein